MDLAGQTGGVQSADEDIDSDLYYLKRMLHNWTRKAAMWTIAGITVGVAVGQIARVLAGSFHDTLAATSNDQAFLALGYHEHVANTGLLAVLPPIVVDGLLLVSRTTAMRVALCVLLSGSLSNNIDRLFLGKVTTYFQIGTGSKLINLPDLLIGVGMVAALILLLDRLARWLSGRTSADSSSSAQ